jgi:hypothetical protein
MSNPSSGDKPGKKHERIEMALKEETILFDRLAKKNVQRFKQIFAGMEKGELDEDSFTGIYLTGVSGTEATVSAYIEYAVAKHFGDRIRPKTAPKLEDLAQTKQERAKALLLDTEDIEILEVFALKALPEHEWLAGPISAKCPGEWPAFVKLTDLMCRFFRQSFHPVLKTHVMEGFEAEIEGAYSDDQGDSAAPPLIG